MDGQRSTLKHKLLNCIFALSLIVGLSAVPALSAQGAEEDELTTQTETSATETAPEASQPAASAGSSQAVAKQPSQSSSETETLNPVEKFGTVLEGESEAALKNATGIAPQQEQTTEEEATEGEEAQLSEEEQKAVAKKNIKRSIISTASYDSSYSPIELRSDCKITIEKTLTADSTIFTTKDKDGQLNAGGYTVPFKVVGERLDDQGRSVCEDADGVWFYVTKNGQVQNEEGFDVYRDGEGKLFYQTGARIFQDDNSDIYVANDSEEAPALLKVDGSGYLTLFDECDEYGNVIEEQKYVGYEDEATGEKIRVGTDDAGDYFILDNDDNLTEEKVTIVEKPLSAYPASGLKPVIVYDNIVGIVMTTQYGARTLENLPFPARYTVTEMTYDEDGYVKYKDPDANTVELVGETKEHKFSFMNKSDDGHTPNSGIVNSYEFSDENGDLSVKQILDFLLPGDSASDSDAGGEE